MNSHSETAESPNWAKGFDVEFLRRVSALFEAHDGEHSRSPFGPSRLDTLAQWLDDKSLQLVQSDDGEIDAALRVVLVDRNKSIRDFAGRSVRIPKGCAHVTRYAVRDGIDAASVARLIKARARLRPIVFEGWMESEFDRAVAAKLRASHVATKISSFSEYRGVWRSKSVPVKYTQNESASLVAVDLDVREQVERLRGSLTDISAWTEHWSNYNERDSWSAIALRGYGGKTEFIVKPAERTRKWQRENADKMNWQCVDTPLLDALPEARAIIDAVPGEKQRVRLMRLRARVGELDRHTDSQDPEHGVASRKIMRVHVVLETNPRVMFQSWNAYGECIERHFGVGEVFYLDVRKGHRAVNTGDEDRIHMVLDVYSNPKLLALLASAR